MDQFTSQVGKPDSLLGIFCANLQVRHIPWPNDVGLVISDSGVSRSAVESLNERRNECQAALRQLTEGGFEINNLSEIGQQELSDVNDLLSERLFKRVRHVVDENMRVVQGMTALREGNSKEFGRLMFESHESSKNLYEVSHENLDLLVNMARGLPGVLGSRLTGAGLGGSTITMVKARHLAEFVKEIGSEYERESGNQPSVYATQIPGGIVVEECGKK